MLLEVNAAKWGSGHHMRQGRPGDGHMQSCDCGWHVRGKDRWEMIEDAIAHLNTTKPLVKAHPPKVSDPKPIVVSRRGRRLRATKAQTDRKSA